MKKNKPKYLPFYMECSKKRRMPVAGLCHLFEIKPRSYPEFRLISPNGKERDDIAADGKNRTWWGSDSYYAEVEKFTTLRQTIVLLMAALNNEL